MDILAYRGCGLMNIMILEDDFAVSNSYETRRNRYEVMKTLSNLKNENSSKLRQ